MIVGLLRLCRLYYALPMSLTYLLTVYYARGGQMTGHWPGDVLSTIAVMLVIAAAYVLNDWADLPADRVNAPLRPIAAGKVSRRVAAIWGSLLMLSGLGIASERWQFGLTLTAVAAGLTAYNLFSKRIGLVKPLLVAALMTSIYPLALAQAGGADGPRAWSLAVFPVWLFPTAFAYELLKDIRDIPGDMATKLSNSLVHNHPYRWRRIANILLAGSCAMLIGPFLLGCGGVYLAGAFIATAMAIASTFRPVRTAIRFIYAECFLVAVAAAADVVIKGI